MSRLRELLNQFEEIANSPRKQLDHYMAAGKPAIGVVPVYTPEEIIHSMGFVPFGVWGADVEIKDAKDFGAGNSWRIQGTESDCDSVLM